MLKDFAQDLRGLREAQKITIAEISAQTRINPKFLNMIEAGIFDFQPETYIRSFLKEYAKCIGVSENMVLTDYEKAKSGFYVRKSGKKEEPIISIKPVSEKPVNPPEPAKEKKLSEEKKESWPEIRKKEINDDNGREFSHKTLTQKILLGLLILAIITGIIYLVDYLYSSGDNGNSNVKPKSFSEISEDYENKIKGKKNEDNQTKQDSLANIVSDSLKLKIVTLKDVRIKVYIDEKRIVEDIIPAKDSMTISAKEQFRFSASANASIDLYLNGEKLKKPSELSGSSSIKNLVINKDGIVSE
jgi:cytoskeletal protein RodZ